MLPSNIPFEEFVLRSLSASPLKKPFFTPTGWHVVKNSVVLECFCWFYNWVFMLRTDSLLNLSPLSCIRKSFLYTRLQPEILLLGGVYSLVQWTVRHLCWCSCNVSKRAVCKRVYLRIFVSVFAVLKMFAKATDIFAPMAIGKNSLAKSVLLRLSLVCAYGDGRFVIIKVFVCCAYCIYSLLLWYICL